MKLDCILTSCNINPMYIDFIPIFVKAWTTLYPNVDIKIILIHDAIPEEYIEYKQYIILCKPIPNVSTTFMSQYIRLLYPALLDYKNGVMITDMDMIPMSSNYYTENIKQFDNNCFVYLRSLLLDGSAQSYEPAGTHDNQICMCYNVALPKIWSDIFEIHSITDIYNRLKEVYSDVQHIDKQQLWNCDQRHLYYYVMKWNKQTKGFKYLHDNNTGYRRLDRNTFMLSQQLKQAIQLGIFSDYHCYRPYKTFKEINDIIVSWL